MGRPPGQMHRRAQLSQSGKPSENETVYAASLCFISESISGVAEAGGIISK